MKVLNITVNTKAKNEMVMNSGITLYPLKLTTKSFWGKIKEIEAYPLSYGPTYGTNFIHYYQFVDGLGNELSDDISRLCTNYCRTLSFKN